MLKASSSERLLQLSPPTLPFLLFSWQLSYLKDESRVGGKKPWVSWLRISNFITTEKRGQSKHRYKQYDSETFGNYRQENVPICTSRQIDSCSVEGLTSWGLTVERSVTPSWPLNTTRWRHQPHHLMPSASVAGEEEIHKMSEKKNNQI